VPGEAVVPVNVSGKLAMRARSTPTRRRAWASPLRTIEIPDGVSSLYTTALGPNEIKNRQINTGEYVHAYYSGVFHLTLRHAARLGAGRARRLERRGRAADRQVRHRRVGRRPTEANALFEVMEFRPFSANGQEGILTVRSLRGQF
jgi:hypothetical protein